MTRDEAVLHINSISRYGNRPGVECTRALLDKLGSPERELNIVHVAGTNGKGSTCAYLAGILRECGLKTGVFTSPHLIRENERIRLDGQDISDVDFAECFDEVHKAEKELIRDGFGQISYFDFFVGIAMLYYKREHADIVVLETGLGGRLDSTNAVENPLLSVITSISLDHVEILGGTVDKIAKEKAGIIKKPAPVVYAAGEGYSKVIENAAKKAGVKAVCVEKSQCEILENTVKYIDFSLNSIYYKDNVFRICTPAEYQVMNAALAATAAAVLKENDASHRLFGSVSDDTWLSNVADGLYKTSWEGRMELIAPGIYIDGAHNPDGIESLLQTAGNMRRLLDGPFVLLFAAVSDKNYAVMIEKICKSGIFDSFIVTQINGTRCLTWETAAYEFEQYTDKPVAGSPGVSDALRMGIERRGNNGTLFCAGSLYLAGLIRKAGLSDDRF